jgi:asparagine synthetase B (glutamine-hydrolysing)
MFLLALTKTPLDVVGVFTQTVRATAVGLHLTVITVSRTGKAIETSRGWQFFESVRLEAGSDSCLTLCRLHFDSGLGILEVSRPLMGGPPVYYHTNDAGELFCSSHISLLRQAGVVLRENKRILPEFFVYRTVLPPSTFFEGVDQVPVGATIRLRLMDRRWRAIDLNYPLLSPAQPQEQIDDVDQVSRQTLQLLEEAILRLGPCKDQLAILLSGGLDSSVIWTICHRIHGINRSYSAGFSFEAAGANLEKEYALSAAAAFGARHFYFEPTPEEYVRGLVESIAAAELPVHHLQSVLLYLLFKDALPREAQVVLTGDQADGLLGSEGLMEVFHRERRLPGASRLLSAAPEPVYVALRTLPALIGRGRAFLEGTFQRNLPLEDPRQLLWSVNQYGSQEWVCQHFGVKSADIIAGRYATLRGFERRSYYDVWAINELLGVTGSIWSALSNACGRTLYSPFWDPEVMKLGWVIPWPIKLKTSKNIVRRVARLLRIPESIVSRPKSSFGIHPERWARPGGVFQLLVPLAEDLFGPEEVRAVQVSAEERAWIFWNMLNYAIWRRVVVDGEPVQRLLDRLGCSIAPS